MKHVDVEPSCCNNSTYSVGPQNRKGMQDFDTALVWSQNVVNPV